MTELVQNDRAHCHKSVASEETRSQGRYSPSVVDEENAELLILALLAP